MYHDTYRCLPAGWRGYDPSTQQPFWFGLPGWAWSPSILPFMEQANLYDGLVHFELPITDPANATARTLELKVFRCPTDIGRTTFSLTGGAASVGTPVSFPVEMATGNYIGVFGTRDFHFVCNPSSAEFNGCVGNGTFYLNRQNRFADLRDGLSNTLIVGERCSKLAPSTWVGVVTGGLHGVARVAGVGAYPPNSEETPAHYFHNFSSFHPSGTNFLSGDGSVKLIAETIAEQTYFALCTRQGGEPAGEY
jgi:hypothetical protein